MRGRLSVVAGLLGFVYVAAVAVNHQVFSRDSAWFNRVHEVAGTAPGRGALALLVVALLFHSLDGLRALLIEYRPSLADRGDGLRAATAFLTGALGVPAAVAILWPALGGVPL